MAEDSIERQLQFFFPKATRADWEKTAAREIDGKDPEESLSWRGKDDIRFLPYYDARDTAGLEYVVPADNGQQTHQWLNLPPVKVSDAGNANKTARDHLAHSANGIFFYLNQHTSVAIDRLINEIDFSSCELFFRFNNDRNFDAACSDVPLHKINGALFWETIPKSSKLSECFPRWKNFRALGLVISPSTPAQEIAEALFEGVRAYEHFAQSANADEVLRSIAFSLAADASFLESIAKIKALRSLWFQIAQAYGHSDYVATELHIHARSLAVSDGAYAPHENMLKSTFAAMAATAAGCDSLTIEAEIDTPLFQRWTTNVSHILREESYFGRVANPVTGAYTVEMISDAIAKKAWEIFQHNINAS